MRHDQCAAGSGGGRWKTRDKRRQNCTVRDEAVCRQFQDLRRDRSAHAPIFDLQLTPPHRPVVTDTARKDVEPPQIADGHADNCADADKPRMAVPAGLGGEQLRRQCGPQYDIEVVTEVRNLLLIIDELHGLPFATEPRKRRSSGGSPHCQVRLGLSNIVLARTFPKVADRCQNIVTPIVAIAVSCKFGGLGNIGVGS